MLILRGHHVSIMVLFAIALHLCWTLMIFLDPSALNATALSALYRYIHPAPLLAMVISSAAMMALAGLFTNRLPWVVILLMLQQAMLMMSAIGAIDAMWLAQFADRVIRPRAFIAADQMYAVLAAIGHTAAIIARAVDRAQDV